MSSRKAPNIAVRSVGLALAFVAVLANAASISAQEPDPEIIPTKLVSGTEPLIADFGAAMSLDGSTLAIGSPTEFRDPGSPGLQFGAVYVFVHQAAGWVEEARLAEPAEFHDGRLGFSVALDGGTLVAGAFNRAAHVFVRDGAGWSHQARLPYPGDDFPTNFGQSAALHGDTLAIGAPLDDAADIGLQQGAVYVFVRAGATWSLQAVLHDPTISHRGFFGRNVALDGDTLIVAAPLAAPAGVDTGSVYAYRRDGETWGLEAVLGPADPQSGMSFGNDVALDGDRALIGAPTIDGIDVDDGAAYVFVRDGSTWSQEAKLTYSNSRSNDLFGFAVSLEGATALIGRPGNLSIEEGNGAHLFTRQGASWSEGIELVDNDSQRGDNFGIATVLELPFAVVGRSTASNRISHGGAAYVFEIPGLSAIERLDALIARVEELRSQGQLHRATPLLAALHGAKRHLERERAFLTKIRLRGFIALTRIWMRLGRVGMENGDDLVAQAQTVIEML